MDPARRKRREEINKSLKFIESSLAYPDPEGYQGFLTQLVLNLLEEGNAFFRDGEWEQAVKEFSEGLNVSCYATTENLQIPEGLQESLYVNRAAAYHSLGKYDEGVKDCDQALEVCKESRRVLYRKALCLKELGKYREAYDCTTDCLLISRLDKQANELAQELAVHLGLKNRKPYVSTKELPHVTREVNTSAEAIKVPCAHLGNGINPLSGLAPVCFPSMPQSSIPSTTPVSSAVPDLLAPLGESELMGDDLDSLLDSFRNEEQLSSPAAAFSVPAVLPHTHTVPPILPRPTPQLPPAFFSSTLGQLNTLDLLSGGGRSTTTVATLDALDDFTTSGIEGVVSPNLGLSCGALNANDSLDSLDDFSDMTPSSAIPENGFKTKLGPLRKSLDYLLEDLDPLQSVTGPGGVRVPKHAVKAAEAVLDSLDVLDTFPLEGVAAMLPAVSIRETSLDSLSDFSSTASHRSVTPVMRCPKNNHKEKNNQAQAAATHPLSSTHEFLQACSACFPRKGKGIYTYVHKPDLVHHCEHDILLCRRKVGKPSEWTRVREIPEVTFFNGPFVLCRELLKSGDLGLCKYGDDCTFAYNQLEIDVWTEERNGMLDRSLLFESTAVKLDPENSVLHVLREHRGVFIYLCQQCYDHKPRIISQRCRDSQTICSNLDARHNFDANKCLYFVERKHYPKHSKIRPLVVLRQKELCRNAIQYGCLRGDACNHAHFEVERKIWRLQRDTGISQDEIVKISTKYDDEQERTSSKHKANRQLPYGAGGSKPRGGGSGKSLNMKMKFVCEKCWLRRIISEPDKNLKYCNAKARDTWTKEKCLLLVKSPERSKWVHVRPLPHTKDFLPLHYDICSQILEKGKCFYPGVCTFAHSQEEKEMWMYMKDNALLDMQQIYDMWLGTLNPQNQPAEGAALTQPIEEKSIAMPTDYAEQTSDFYCHLCGKHSNSERQWQRHISTEKHKDRVFSCEGEDALTWRFRFPGRHFELCPKLEDGCPDGVSCDYAHGPEELQEWKVRRDFLRRKLSKAREDMLVMPDERDFGKYNFLLQC